MIIKMKTYDTEVGWLWMVSSFNKRVWGSIKECAIHENELTVDTFVLGR